MGPAGRGRKHLAQWATRTPGYLSAALVPQPWPKQHISDTLRPAAALSARQRTRPCRCVLLTHSSRKTSCHPRKLARGRRGRPVSGSSTRRTAEEKGSFGINQKSCVPRRRSEIMSPIIISAAPAPLPRIAPTLPARSLAVFRTPTLGRQRSWRRRCPLVFISPRRPKRSQAAFALSNCSATFRQAVREAVDIGPEEKSMPSLALKLISQNYCHPLLPPLVTLG